MGYPLCTPEIIETLANSIRAGCSRKGSARGAGISPTTFQEWMDMGEIAYKHGEEVTVAVLYETILRAESELEQHLTRRWYDGIMNDDQGWKGAENMLAKRFRDEWGSKQQIDVTASTVNPLNSPVVKQALDLILTMVPEDKQAELANKLAELSKNEQ